MFWTNPTNHQRHLSWNTSLQYASYEVPTNCASLSDGTDWVARFRQWKIWKMNENEWKWMNGCRMGSSKMGLPQTGRCKEMLKPPRSTSIYDRATAKTKPIKTAQVMHETCGTLGHVYASPSQRTEWYGMYIMDYHGISSFHEFSDSPDLYPSTSFQVSAEPPVLQLLTHSCQPEGEEEAALTVCPGSKWSPRCSPGKMPRVRAKKRMCWTCSMWDRWKICKVLKVRTKQWGTGTTRCLKMIQNVYWSSHSSHWWLCMDMDLPKQPARPGRI